jgi:hypothetical protein
LHSRRRQLIDAQKTTGDARAAVKDVTNKAAAAINNKL